MGCRCFIPSGVICVCARCVRPRRRSLSRSQRICCVGVRACCPFAPPRARAASLFLYRSCWRSHVEYCAPPPLFSSFSSSTSTNGTKGRSSSPGLWRGAFYGGGTTHSPQIFCFLIRWGLWVALNIPFLVFPQKPFGFYYYIIKTVLADFS